MSTSDYRQVIKFWPSCAPGIGGLRVGENFYYSQRAVFASPEHFFHYKCMKALFAYKRFDSATYMPCDLSLPSFDTYSEQ